MNQPGRAKPTYWLRLYWLRRWRTYGAWFVTRKIAEIERYREGGRSCG